MTKSTTLNQAIVEPVVGCDFSNARLVARYGSWFAVQVAFYDFLFESSMKYNARQCNEIIREDFADGSDPYKRAKHAVELKYPAMSRAWTAFLCANTPRKKP